MFDVYGLPINAPAIRPLGRVGETRSSDPSYIFGLAGNYKLVPETDGSPLFTLRGIRTSNNLG